MSTGVVNSFDVEKGYGYIHDHGTSKDVFVHVTGLIDSIKAGDEVTFDIVEDNNGPRAINVRKV
jgi:cold shock protein